MAFLLGLGVSALAAEQRGALALIKEPLDPTVSSDVCVGIFDVTTGKDVPNMRTFRHHYCQGRYTLTLEGERGQVVTLFGRSDFNKENGFLILRKTDDRKVWLLDLEGMPSEQWLKRAPTGDSGGIQVFYQAAPNFSQDISSVKWGHWWQGPHPQ